MVAVEKGPLKSHVPCCPLSHDIVLFLFDFEDTVRDCGTHKAAYLPIHCFRSQSGRDEIDICIIFDLVLDDLFCTWGPLLHPQLQSCVLLWPHTFTLSTVVVHTGLPILGRIYCIPISV